MNKFLAIAFIVCSITNFSFASATFDEPFKGTRHEVTPENDLELGLRFISIFPDTENHYATCAAAVVAVASESLVAAYQAGHYISRQTYLDLRANIQEAFRTNRDIILKIQIEIPPNANYQNSQEIMTKFFEAGCVTNTLPDVDWEVKFSTAKDYFSKIIQY